MNTLDISTRLLSEAVWKRVLESSAHRLREKSQPFFQLLGSLEALRAQAAYNTGSISTAAAWTLYSLAHYFRPRRLLEVGTFIGKSTLALASGADDAGSGTDLHTCDMSNVLELPRATRCEVRQYPGQSSTAMFTQLAANHRTEAPFELLYLDGRLTSEDLPLLNRICSPDLIVALDDFEGIEKGVANLITVRNAQFLTSHMLVYPCSESVLHSFGFADHSTVALLIPQACLRFTAQ